MPPCRRWAPTSGWSIARSPWSRSTPSSAMSRSRARGQFRCRCRRSKPRPRRAAPATTPRARALTRVGVHFRRLRLPHPCARVWQPRPKPSDALRPPRCRRPPQAQRLHPWEHRPRRARTARRHSCGWRSPQPPRAPLQLRWTLWRWKWSEQRQRQSAPATRHPVPAMARFHRCPQICRCQKKLRLRPKAASSAAPKSCFRASPKPTPSAALAPARRCRRRPRCQPHRHRRRWLRQRSRSASRPSPRPKPPKPPRTRAARPRPKPP